jgi:AcrR family transcriptional regulator
MIPLPTDGQSVMEVLLGRVVKEYDERYTEFLDVAQQLFYKQGYEWTSVQTIINTVGVAKGTFYHYFDSKEELLDALVVRGVGATLALVEPLVNDESLNAVTKLELFFTRTIGWKAANRTILMEMVRVLYEDKNVLLRTKIQREGLAMVAPIMAKIIGQGIDEGDFVVAHSPEEIAGIVLSMIQSLSEGIARLLLQEKPQTHPVIQVEQKVAAYERSIERVLGANESTLHLFNLDDIRVWFE